MKTKSFQRTKENEIRVLNAITDLAGIVSATLGPGGRPILIERENHPPLSTKDGVTVARAYRASGTIERIVTDAAKEVCERTVRLAGDGPQPLHSKVLTPTGFVLMRDVRVGMEICGLNGTTQVVVGVFPKGSKEIYEIEFENGGVVECCADHLWSVTDVATLKNVKKVITTAEMFTNYVQSKPFGYKRYRYYTPRTHAEFHQDDSKMPLHPYLVGLMIGGGSLSGSGAVELSLEENVLKNLNLLWTCCLPEGIEARIHYVENKKYFRVKLSGREKSTGKTMAEIFKKMGLYGALSNTKFIPKEYLYSSFFSRKALLQGLIDTDGYVNSRGLFEFSTVSERLCDDFIELARGLGKTVYKKIHDRSRDPHSYSSSPIYRVTELKGYKHGDKIVRITPTGHTAPMQCIKVSGADSLYITDNYKVTHNTTTAIVLAADIVKEGQRFLDEHPEYSPQRVSRELKNLYQDKIKPSILALSKSITDLSEEESEKAIRHVALVSANHDEEIAEAVAKAVSSVGEDGMVTAEEGAGTETRVEYSEGFSFMSGLHDLGPAAGPAFVNRQDFGDCRIDTGAYVVLYDGEINDIGTIAPLMEKVASLTDENGHHIKASMVVFAHRFSDFVLKTFAQNFRRGTLTIVPVITPRNGQAVGRSQFLHDLSAYCDGHVFDAQGTTLNEATPFMLGTIDSIKVGRSEGLILGKPVLERVDQRIAELKAQMNDLATSEFDREMIRYRIGRMTGGVATIYAGGASALEAKERHARVVDAISAVRSAIQQGVVPGGGATLAVISDSLSGDGVESILGEAILAPFYRILENVGLQTPDIRDLLQKIGKNENDEFFVYDALAQKLVNWWDSGILDPAKVTLSALENALSVAQLLMTLGGVIGTEFTDEEQRIKMMQDGILKRVEEEALE